MKRLVIICLILSCISQLQGQGDIINSNIKYRAEVKKVNWKNVPINPEPTWKFDGATYSLSSKPCSNSGYSGDVCIAKSNDNTHNNLNVTFKTGTNNGYNSRFYYKVMAFENDNDILGNDNPCTYDSNDDELHCGGGDDLLTDYPQNHFGNWSEINVGGASKSWVEIRTIWAYKDGQWRETSALNFGPVSCGATYDHHNRTESIGLYKGTYYGYKNTFHPGGTNVPSDAPAQAAPDVVYSFQVQSDEKKVNISSSTHVSGFNHYIHLIRDQGGTFTHIASNNSISPSLSEVLVPGDYLIVVEGAGSSKGSFDLKVEVPEPTLDPGMIDHAKPFVQKGCRLTSPIFNQEDASSDFGTQFYFWQKKLPHETEWSWVNNAISATLSPSELGDINEDVEIRRVAGNSCSSLQAYTEPITIETIDNNTIGGKGRIEGEVTGKNGLGKIQGVTVFAIPASPINGACPDQVYSGVTLQNGRYVIPEIYHGNGTTAWKIYPKYFDHKFQPDTFYLDLSAQVFEFEEINFADTTSLLIEGRLVQEDSRSLAETTCGIQDVPMLLNGEATTSSSDDLGNYAINVINRTNDNNYIVRPNDPQYDFVPVQTPNMFLLSDTSGVDFVNEQLENLSGYVVACDTFCFGRVRLNIEDVSGCFKFKKTTNSCGFFSINLPIREYVVSFDRAIASTLEEGYDAGEIDAYFEEVRDTVDIRSGAKEVFFNYRQRPEIEILDLPLICNDTVFTQGEAIDITFHITEENTNGCELDTGVLIIHDEISNKPEQMLPISKGYAIYTVEPGEPNIFASTGYKKGFTVTAQDIVDPDRRSSITFKAIVQGNKAREATFTTVSPEIPLLILRDPPGDKSYSFVKESESTEFGFSLYAQREGGIETYTKTKSGIAFSVGMGYSTETAVVANVEGQLAITAKNSSSTDQVWSITTGQEFSTSADDGAMGRDADLFVASALNIRYALTDIRTYNEQQCRIDESVDIIMGADSIKTLTLYTTKDIESLTIPRLIELRDAISDPDSMLYYNDQISIWRQLIQRNDDLKAAAIPDTIPNISWSGSAGAFKKYSTTSSSKSISFDIGLEIESSIAATAGFSVAGIGLESGVKIRSRIELGGGFSGSTSSQRTHGFELDDDDDEDFYETEIFYDPVYQTHVFRNTSSGSTCPYAGGSLIDNPILAAESPVVEVANPGDTARFKLFITNGTELPDSSDFRVRSYTLSVDEASNPESASITAGSNLPITFTLDKGQTVPRKILIQRTDNSVHSLEGIKLLLYPTCEGPSSALTRSIELTAHWPTTCSNITMNEPAPGWLINENSDNSINFKVTNYNKDFINNVIVEYSRAGLNDWNEGPIRSAASLGETETFINWNTSSLFDGAYDVRIKLTCNEGVIYTERVTGRIDRTKASILGLPAPVDDVYDPMTEDRISAKMTERIDCSQATAILMNMETDEVYPAQLTCGIDEVEVVPIDILTDFDPAAYRVVITNVKDIAGNTSKPLRWAFIVGDYVFDPDCSPIMLSNNNVEQDGITQYNYYSQSIDSDGTIKDRKTVGLIAEEEIEFLQNFQVEEGGTLEASIDTCPNDD